MILKWHQGHSGPVGWLAGWPTGWLNDWGRKKKRPEAHNLAGLASGFPAIVAPKHLTVNTELGHFSRNILHVTHLLTEVIRCFIHKKKGSTPATLSFEICLIRNSYQYPSLQFFYEQYVTFYQRHFTSFFSHGHSSIYHSNKVMYPSYEHITEVS